MNNKDNESTERTSLFVYKGVCCYYAMYIQYKDVYDEKRVDKW